LHKARRAHAQKKPLHKNLAAIKNILTEHRRQVKKKAPRKRAAYFSCFSYAQNL
jgi:hypothetical protein